MNQKVGSVLIAMIMIVIAGTVLVSDQSSADSDVAVSPGNVKVNYNATGTSTWSTTTVDAYNIYLAVYGAKDILGYAFTTTGANTQWDVDEGGYSNPNKEYGLIDQFNGSSSFSIMGFDSVDAEWQDITDVALGWLRPYADYSAVEVSGAPSSAYANIAIIQGAATVASINQFEPLTVVEGDSDYLYAFTLVDSSATVSVPAGTQVKVMSDSGLVMQDLTSEQLQTGIVVYGYGSDAYLALKDAVGSSLQGQMESWINHGGYYTYYSWMTSLFGVGTSSVTGDDGTVEYHYWASYDSNGGYLNWTLGYYSAAHFGSNVETVFSIIYS